MVVVQAGAICDNIEKARLKSNRSKLRSTMRMFGISEVTGIISLELQTVTPTSAVPTNVGTVKYVYYQMSNDDDECKYTQI
jgi:hypothetical protein